MGIVTTYLSHTFDISTISAHLRVPTEICRDIKITRIRFYLFISLSKKAAVFDREYGTFLFFRRIQIRTRRISFTGGTYMIVEPRRNTCTDLQTRKPPTRTTTSRDDTSSGNSSDSLRSTSPQSVYDTLYSNALRILAKEPENPEAIRTIAKSLICRGWPYIARLYMNLLGENPRTQEDAIISALIQEGCASVTRLVPSPSGPVQAVDRMPRAQADLVRLVNLAMLAAKGSVFVFGCGLGDLPVMLSAFGLEVYGVDPDPLLVDITRYRFYTLGLTCGHFRPGGFDAQPDQDSSFDSVVLVDAVDRVQDPGFLLREAQRLVKPGGRILISVPDSYCVTRPDKVSIFTEKSFLRTLEENLEGTLTPLEPYGSWLSGVVVVDKPGEASCPDESLYLKPFQVPRHDNPLVSIVVPTYNRAALLARSLDSLLGQTYENTEIIVVNDGSTDATDQVIAPYLDKVKYLKQPNRGSPSAMNAGIKEARGKYIWVFADDDIALPRKLEVQVPLMEASGAGLIHAGAICVNEDFSVTQVWVPQEFLPDSIMEAELFGNRFFSSTVMVPKKVMEDVGMYDERLVRAQDYDCWIRILQKYSAVAVDYLSAFYWQHAGSRGSSFDSFDVSQVVRKTLEYEKIIFDKVYNSIPLEDAFPKVAEFGSPVVETEALLTRAVLVARRGLLGYAARDIERARNLMKLHPFTLSAKGRECVKILGDHFGECQDKVLARNALMRLRDLVVKSREQ